PWNYVVATEAVPLKTNADSVVRVGKTRVTLDTVVHKFDYHSYSPPTTFDHPYWDSKTDNTKSDVDNYGDAMKFNQGIRNFWFQVANFWVSSAVTILLAFWWYGWNLATTIAFFLFLCFIWLLIDTKSRLLKALPGEYQFQPAVLEDFPLLNFTWLQQQTTSLESLGFVHLRDYKLGASPSFGRCFAHPQQYCFAEIGQVFKPTGEVVVMQSGIFSQLEQDWALDNINRELNSYDAIAYIWRGNKSVRIYKHHNNLGELLQAHLEFRQRMINDLSITVCTDISWDNFVELGKQSAAVRRQTMRRKNILLAMVEATLFQMNPKTEWLGDYPKMADKRRATN
ncbi:MAG TPA: hypothetical protein V6D33_06525, partial [Cyanophyceae cyanobacterium]